MQVGAAAVPKMVVLGSQGSYTAKDDLAIPMLPSAPHRLGITGTLVSVVLGTKPRALCKPQYIHSDN